MLSRQRPIGAMRGFSLIEAMITVAILAIIGALAMPAFQSTLANFRMRTGAEGLLNGLQLARTEAVRQNRNIFFCINPVGTTGWIISREANCPIPPVNLDSTIQRRPASEGGNLTVAANINNLTFNSLGRASAAMNITVSSSIAGTQTLSISQFTGGQVRMCDPAVTAANDPRRC